MLLTQIRREMLSVLNMFDELTRMFYVRLTIPLYSGRSSRASLQEEQDAHQTSWLGCHHRRTGWHRNRGGCLRPGGPRKVGLSIGPEDAADAASDVDQCADGARRRQLDGQRELDPAGGLGRRSGVGHAGAQRN